jgi:single-strand DNA-binding protein
VDEQIRTEVVSQYMKKGGMVMIEGRLQTRNWQDKQDQKRSTTEIIAERVQMGPRASGQDFKGPSQGKDSFSQETKQELPEINIEEELRSEDIPF